MLILSAQEVLNHCIYVTTEGLAGKNWVAYQIVFFSPFAVFIDNNAYILVYDSSNFLLSLLSLAKRIILGITIIAAYDIYKHLYNSFHRQGFRYLHSKH